VSGRYACGDCGRATPLADLGRSPGGDRLYCTACMRRHTAGIRSEQEARKRAEGRPQQLTGKLTTRTAEQRRRATAESLLALDVPPLSQLPEPAECRRLRRSAHVPAEVVAVLAGVTAAAVWKWERGEARPASEHEFAYCRALALCEAYHADRLAAAMPPQGGRHRRFR